MRLGIALEDHKGLQGNIAEQLGQCESFFLLDIESNKIKQSRVVANTAACGRGEYVVADELLKYRVTHVVACGMSSDAQSKFTQAGVKVFGYSGKAKDAINDFLKNKIGTLGAYKERGACR